MEEVIYFKCNSVSHKSIELSQVLNQTYDGSNTLFSQSNSCRLITVYFDKGKVYITFIMELIKEWERWANISFVHEK
jgi:hypothetical protein